jgi:hypothetical protein
MFFADLIFGVGSIIFFAALIPSINSPDKPALMTSLLTWTVLWAFAITYFTIGLPFAALTSFATGCLWAILAMQKYEQENYGKAS